MAGIDFFSFAEGARIAENDARKAEMYQRQREHDDYAFGRRQQLDQQRDAEYSNTQLDKEDNRIVSEGIVSLQNAVATAARERNVDAPTIWEEVARGANLEGASPRAANEFQKKIDAQFQMMIGDAIKRGDVPLATRLSRVRGLTPQENTSAIAAYSDPAVMAAGLAERGYIVGSDGKVDVGGIRLGAREAYEAILAGGGIPLGRTVANQTALDANKAQTASQMQQLNTQQDVNQGLQAQQAQLGWVNYLDNSMLNQKPEAQQALLMSIPDAYFTNAGTTRAAYAQRLLPAAPPVLPQSVQTLQRPVVQSGSPDFPSTPGGASTARSAINWQAKQDRDAQQKKLASWLQ